MKLEKTFDPDLLYNHIVHYYVDKKGYNKEQANEIAQKIITKESQRRICKNNRCRHMSHKHIKNQGICFVLHCTCTEFVK
jgi:hypothetical protein